MENDEQLKNMELQQEGEHDIEAEGYDDDEFDNENNENMEDAMETEGEGHDQDNQMVQNPYDQRDMIRNTFYPSQNPMIGPGLGGALRPVSANVPKSRK